MIKGNIIILNKSEMRRQKYIDMKKKANKLKDRYINQEIHYINQKNDNSKLENIQITKYSNKKGNYMFKILKQKISKLWSQLFQLLLLNQPIFSSFHFGSNSKQFQLMQKHNNQEIRNKRDKGQTTDHDNLLSNQLIQCIIILILMLFVMIQIELWC
ncbi:unnamed protein product [Paramecium sonneborni]|uniref:Transmembrane protein n=1 Tax=Paramecium sonneborni TaxID=65129 RepID=A0A8S1NVU6_9CILI|nr:unnamed protein product [Paramecium sonneborni]